MLEITLIGYGNQGKAWAANLRDSGWKVRVSGRPKESGGQSLYAAAHDGFEVIPPQQLEQIGGKVALLLPDDSIPDFYHEFLAGSGPARSLVFAHGFSVVFGGIKFRAEDDIILVAPKGIGTKLRENYLAGSGVLAVLAVEKNTSDAAWDRARAISRGLGCARVGNLESRFKDETFADLISEQAILCGLVPQLVDQTVRFLVEKGIDPKLATYECLHELKLIVDMMVEHGIAGMYRRVSKTAYVGGLQTAQAMLPEAALREHLEKLWQNVESGSFAKSLEGERAQKYPSVQASLAQLETGPTDQNL